MRKLRSLNEEQRIQFFLAIKSYCLFDWGNSRCEADVLSRVGLLEKGTLADGAVN